MHFFAELRKRNAILWWFGWLNLAGALVCLVMTQANHSNIVLGINAWIKPMKFFFSIWIFCWTIAWYMHYLTKQRKVVIYSWMVVVVMTFEQLVIVWQAANGRLSHFNISTPFYGMLFSLMGIAITILTIWTGYIDFIFFRQKSFPVSMAYIWGIRLGILFFVVFAFEGGVMAVRLAHTIGAPDGGNGYPVINWSRQYGDLRVAHFFGMHALQLLPLAGYYIAKKTGQIILLAIVYFAFVALLFVQALKAMPLFF